VDELVNFDVSDGAGGTKEGECVDCSFRGTVGWSDWKSSFEALAEELAGFGSAFDVGAAGAFSGMAVEGEGSGDAPSSSLTTRSRVK
jgi:hypothetical protein